MRHHVLSPHVQMEEPQTRTVVDHRSEGGTLASLSLERVKRFGESFTEDAGIKATPPQLMGRPYRLLMT
jgi:hypothetical protein